MPTNVYTLTQGFKRGLDFMLYFNFCRKKNKGMVKMGLGQGWLPTVGDDNCVSLFSLPAERVFEWRFSFDGWWAAPGVGD